MKKKISVFLRPALVAMVLVLGLCGTASAITGDLDGDNCVDWNDLGVLADRWLNTGCSAADWCGGADIDHSSKVDFNDFGLFALHWLESTDSNLVGWWKFDEGSGTDANDSSGYGNHGTLYGDPNWVAGRIGVGALDFDGDGDYVQIPDDDSLTPSSEISIAFWLYNRGGQDAGIYKRASCPGEPNSPGASRAYVMKVADSTGKLTLRIYSPGDYTDAIESNNAVTLDQWHHIAGTFDQGEAVVYIDGQLDNSDTLSVSSIWNDAQPLIIGGQWEYCEEDSFLSNLNGKADDVRIYDRALTAGEIWPLYQQGMGEKAFNPYPADGVVDVEPDVVLSWSPGYGAVSHDVYLGTDYDDVNDADVDDPNVYMGNQTATSYDPNGLEYETAYYWRIDEVNDSNDRCKGDVWGFTTESMPPPPGQASNPSPSNTATGVSINADLSWTAGAGATSHDVYFGTDSTPDSGEFKGNQPGTTFDPGTMSYSTTYYWRIDEKNAYGTTTGDVWSFTTESMPPPPGQASNPNPSNTATDVSISANLSWTAGAGATSHDVYFGTDSTPDSGEFQGNQLSTHFDPGIMDVSTTYYWRIDEKNASGTTTGVVWSFTTETTPTGPGQAGIPYPSDGAADIRTTTAYLSWKAGSDATSRDVYFGTDSTPDASEFQGSQISMTFKPGTMAEGVTYYWRIDEKNAGGTITGDVWSFTTSVFPDVADLGWDNVIAQPWDSPDRLDHFDDFITANGAHPRLLLTQADVNDLKSKISSGIYNDMWLVIKNKADGYLSSSPRNNPGSESDTRSDGDAVPWLAMAYLMTDNTAYLNKAVSWMTTVCNYSEWDGNGSLGAGHCLMGVSLAFDWLYNDMTPTQRNTILNGSSGTRGLTYFANQMANGSPSHKERYLANHCQVEYGGLSAAGFALYGEVTAAESWLRKAYNIFDAAFRVCGNDGSSTEGHNYYGLMTEFQMHFDKMAKQLLGRDFYAESEWLRNIGSFILYSNLPDFSSGDNIMRYGDTSSYTYGSHGPVYQMFNVASEYNEPYYQWLALEMFDRAVGTGDRMGWSCLLWYDDTIASTAPSDGNLPTYRHFESTGWITSRSGWDADAVMVGFKCGPFHGHAVQALYDEMTSFHQIVNGHGHPDVQHFNVYAYGQRLATDDAYSKPKWTYYHSTMLAGTGTIGASGQLGDTYTSGSSWFDRDEVFNAGATSAIIKAESTTEYDYIIGDAENIYREHFDNGGDLTKFLRHFIYIKPDIVVIVDELESNSTASGYYRWRMRYEGSASGSGDYYTVSNSDVRMDTHFVHTQSISTSVSGTYILAGFDSTGSDLLVTVLHPRRNTDSACTIDYSSIVGTDIELTITTASGTISVDIDLATQEVTIY